VLVAAALFALAPARAALAADVTVGSIDLTGATFTCTVGPVVFAGTGTFRSITTSVASGATTAALVVDLRGVTANASATGVTYAVRGVTATGFLVPAPGSGSASVTRFVQTWTLVPLSGGRTISFHEVLNVVVAAGGRISVVVANGPADCD
jgi:hypothetical protein